MARRVLSAKQKDALARWGEQLPEDCVDDEAFLVRKALEAKALEEEVIASDEDGASSEKEEEAIENDDKEVVNDTSS